MSQLLVDRAGRRRSPATMPGFHAGRPPRNKGLRYPADPPKVEEIIAVMGLGRAAALARATRRAAALRHQRPDTRSALVERRRPSGYAPDGRPRGVRRRFAPHQLRHAHAVELAREGVPLIIIQRQLGHSNLGIASVYLQGIDNAEIIETVRARRQPMIPVSTSPPR